MDLYLYLVTATNSDYDTFSEGVVYAESPFHAKEIVRDLCAKRAPAPANAGLWLSLYDSQDLHARRVSVRPGPVMGYSRAG